MIIGDKIFSWLAHKILRLILKYTPEETLYIYHEIYDLKRLEIKYISFREKYDIHKEFLFSGSDISFYGEGEIICGKSYIGNLSTIQSAKGCTVKIGNNCAISHNVRIYSETYIADQDFSIIPRKQFRENVNIEDNVWIGANVFICPGVTIGENSVIGANAVVTKDIPPYSIAAGVPARVLKKKSTQ